MFRSEFGVFRLTAAEQRAELNRRTHNAVRQLTKHHSLSPQAASLLHLMDLKREGYTTAHYQATCEYGTAWSAAIVNQLTEALIQCGTTPC